MLYPPRRKGTRLSDAQALAVRKMGREYTYEVVARMFGISTTYVGAIVTGKLRRRATARVKDVRAATREAKARYRGQ